MMENCAKEQGKRRSVFGDPVCLILGLTDSKRAIKTKQKSTLKGCFFDIKGGRRPKEVQGEKLYLRGSIFYIDNINDVC